MRYHVLITHEQAFEILEITLCYWSRQSGQSRPLDHWVLLTPESGYFLRLDAYLVLQVTTPFNSFAFQTDYKGYRLRTYTFLWSEQVCMHK